MFVRLFKSSFLASIIFLVGAQVYTPEAYAKTTFIAKKMSHASTSHRVARPVSGRNRRRAIVGSYHSLYPRALNDQIIVSTKVNKLRINVLTNDSGRHLRIRDVNKQSAKGGRIYVQGQHVVYLPRKNFQGWDSFWYAIVDVNGHRHSAKVNVCVCKR
jgi:hypothetical protein